MRFAVALAVFALPMAALAGPATVVVCSASGSGKRVPAPGSEQAPACAHWCDVRRRPGANA
ncbi:hypothetical protein [Sandaracinobacteroides hominis]|uniref:hypothetical protein n=1 Tax=Sandaracinobacteroides hominis TaxID=2780086 RepID=UPI0018F54444|nr:hypothetical protein [Sandaracinobacteroides hominis]